MFMTEKEIEIENAAMRWAGQVSFACWLQSCIDRFGGHFVNAIAAHEYDQWAGRLMLTVAHVDRRAVRVGSDEVEALIADASARGVAAVYEYTDCREKEVKILITGEADLNEDLCGYTMTRTVTEREYFPSSVTFWMPDDAAGLIASDYDYDWRCDGTAWIDPSECSELHSTPETRALDAVRMAMARVRNAATLVETDAALSESLSAVDAAVQMGLSLEGVKVSILKARKSLVEAARHDTRQPYARGSELMAQMDALLAHRARQAARAAGEPAASEPAAADSTPLPHEEVEFVNLTPHAVNIQREDGTMLVVPPSGELARRAETRESCAPLAGIRTSRVVFGEVTGLPEPREGVIYIVSGLVLAAVPDRADVVAPGAPIRDEQGRVIGAGELSVTPAYGLK